MTINGGMGVVLRGCQLSGLFSNFPLFAISLPCPSFDLVKAIEAQCHHASQVWLMEHNGAAMIG